MLTLRPYSIPINPSKKQVIRILGVHGFLLGSKERELDDGRIVTLKRWAREEPEFENIGGKQKFAIIRVFIHYIVDHPDTDLIKKTGKTKENWQLRRLSRIVTLWIPLQNNVYNFLLSVGNIDEEDVKILLNKLLPDINTDQIKAEEFDLKKVRKQNKEGWLHGCQERPRTIERGTFYGDFDFEEPGELGEFIDKPPGTKSNQEGIFLSKRRGRWKVRVLNSGKFQLMGIQIKNEKFSGGHERAEIMKECFRSATKLLKAKSKD